MTDAAPRAAAGGDGTGEGGRHHVLVDPDDPRLDAFRRAFDGPFRRFVLIANNPALRRRSFERLALGPEDLVLQFSRALHFDALADIPCGHAFLFVEVDGTTYHGFDREGRPDRPYDRVAGAPLILAFKRNSEHGSLPRVAGFLSGIARPVQVAEFYGKALPDLAYAPDKKPSTGLLVIRFLQHLNARRRAEGRSAVPIHLVGFTSRGRDLHGWNWERAWIAAQPDLVNHLEPWLGLREALGRLRRRRR